MNGVETYPLVAKAGATGSLISKDAVAIKVLWQPGVSKPILQSC
jgi:hypothetical protein